MGADMIKPLQPRDDRRFRAAKHIAGKTACGPLNSNATMMGVALRTIELGHRKTCCGKNTF
jgi:hypothetical protein